MKQSTIFFSVIIILFLGALFAVIATRSGTPAAPSDGGKYDAFAQCLTNKGVKFYGAFWCPHCKAEKALFGSAASLLPYVECSTPDATGQTQICIDNKITGYPTFVFADGSRVSGETPLADLAQKSGCTLPQ